MLQTKAKVTGDEWGDNYYLVGPYTEQGVRTQVELLEPPTPALKRTLDSMNNKGCKVGHGLAEGRKAGARGQGGSRRWRRGSGRAVQEVEGWPGQKPGVAWYFPQADTEEVRFTDTQIHNPIPNPWKWVGESQAQRHW